MAEYYMMNKNKKLMLFSVVFDETMGEYDCKEIDRYGERYNLPKERTDFLEWIVRRQIREIVT